MRNGTRIVIGVFVTVGLTLLPVAQGQEASPAEAVNGQLPEVNPAGNGKDREVIEKNAEAFEAAFNSKDLEAIGQQFDENADYIDADGRVSRGRAMIVEDFQQIFESSPESRLQLIVEEIRFIGDDVAIEDGIAIVVSEATPAGSRSRYTVVHVRRDGGWKILRVQDASSTLPTHNDRLQELAWMVGSWVDESDESLVETSCDWGEGGSFLLRQFLIRRAGEALMEGTSRIGWDPLRKQIRSWVFDSSGGFAEGYWTRAGNQWIVKVSSVQPDGTVTSATNIITYIDPDRFAFRSIDRVVAGELIEDSPVVTIVRRPPVPVVEDAGIQTPSN